MSLGLLKYLKALFEISFRHKVKEFAQKTANSSRSDGKKCPNYKLIILDEADSMTKSAQEALRRTMEVYRKIFISFIYIYDQAWPRSVKWSAS